MRGVRRRIDAGRENRLGPGAAGQANFPTDVHLIRRSTSQGHHVAVHQRGRRSCMLSPLELLATLLPTTSSPRSRPDSLALFRRPLAATDRRQFAGIQEDTGAIRAAIDLDLLVELVCECVHLDVTSRTPDRSLDGLGRRCLEGFAQRRTRALALMIKPRQLAAVEPNPTATIAAYVDEDDAKVLALHHGLAGGASAGWIGHVVRSVFLPAIACGFPQGRAIEAVAEAHRLLAQPPARKSKSR